MLESSDVDAEGGPERDAALQTDGAAVSLALSRARSRSRKTGDEAVDRFLDDQRGLIADQRAHLREQTKQGGLRRASEGLRLALQAGAVLIGLGLSFAVGAMIWVAAHQAGVVVQSFETPPALAAQGLSGTATAQAVLDRLSAIQEATRFNKPGRTISNAWAREIRIEAPGTGLSLGEIERLLHERLGHNVRLGGTLVQELGGGLALTVRGDGIPARTFHGGAGDYPLLAGQAAEYLMSVAEPLWMIRYLYTNQRAAEALPLWARTMARANPAEEVRLFIFGGDTLWVLGRYDEAAELYRTGIARTAPGSRPDSLKDDLVWVLAYAGREQQALEQAFADQRSEGAISDGGRRMREELSYAHKLIVNDWNGFHRTWAVNEASNRATGGSGGSLAAPMMAYASARLHDWDGVRSDLLNSEPEHPSTVAMRSLVGGMRALDEGRPADAVAPLSAYAKLWRENELVRYDLHDAPCRLALALALTGRRVEAETVIAQTGRYVECFTARANGLEAAGDRAGADRAFAAAIALAPGVAFAYDAYGRALLARGDLGEALANFSLADARAPRWADPLKGSGDVLTRQGHAAQALAAYDKAIGLAPRWGELRRARASAAAQAAQKS